MGAGMGKASSSRLFDAVGVNVHKWNEILCVLLVSGVRSTAAEESYGRLGCRCL